MGQKIHPLGFRLGTTQKHRSLWFSSSKIYPELIQEDYKIRHYLEKKLENASISQISIYRKFNQIEIVIYAARPGIIIGQGAEKISNIRQELENQLKNTKSIRFNVIEIKQPDKEAALIANFITKKLEQRVVFRKAVRQALMRSQQAKIKGIKIQVSGRLNGAEIARTEWVREGVRFIVSKQYVDLANNKHDKIV